MPSWIDLLPGARDFLIQATAFRSGSTNSPFTKYQKRTPLPTWPLHFPFLLSSPDPHPSSLPPHQTEPSFMAYGVDYPRLRNPNDDRPGETPPGSIPCKSSSGTYVCPFTFSGSYQRHLPSTKFVNEPVLSLSSFAWWARCGFFHSTTILL